MISLFAVWLGERPPTSTRTFGYHRAEVIGALASVLLIWLLTGVLVYEAIIRVITPEPVDGRIMFIVATLGLGVNLGMMKILHSGGGGHGHSHGGHGHAHGNASSAGSGSARSDHGQSHNTDNGAKEAHGHSHVHSHGDERVEHGHSHDSGAGHAHSHGHGDNVVVSSSAEAATSTQDPHRTGSSGNINVRAAFIHALGDLIQSIGVMIAAAIIWAVPDAHIADPICTFIFSILVLFTTIGIVRQALFALLNTVPSHINLSAVARELQTIQGVSNVHDLHVWSFGADRVAMTVHIVADNVKVALREALVVANAHGIMHSTVQVEHCGSSDVTACFTHNEHVDGCEIVLPETPVQLALENALESDVRRRARSSAGTQLDRARVGRPNASLRHSMGCGTLVSPPPVCADCEDAPSAPHHGTDSALHTTAESGGATAQPLESGQAHTTSGLNPSERHSDLLAVCVPVDVIAAPETQVEAQKSGY
jgi:solute carrier family 30 (zinc transporter), member 2